MEIISFRRHRFPPDIIQYAVWLYYRFTLSFRDVDDLMAERGIDVSYETIRRWTEKFGRAYASRLQQRRPRPSSTWHVDEVFVMIDGKQMYLWRAVDDEGEVLDVLLQSPASAHCPWRSAASRGLFAEKRNRETRSAGAESSLNYAEICPMIGE